MRCSNLAKKACSCTLLEIGNFTDDDDDDADADDDVAITSSFEPHPSSSVGTLVDAVVAQLSSINTLSPKKIESPSSISIS